MNKISETIDTEFQESYTKILNIVYDILEGNEYIKEYYKINKAKNAIVCEPPSREFKIDISISIEMSCVLQNMINDYPIVVTKSEYNKWFIIMVDKIKYRKYIIRKLLK